MAAPPDLQSASVQRRFVYGAMLPLNGLRMMVTDRRLWPFVITPILVTSVLMGAAWLGSAELAPQIVEALFHRPEADGRWLTSLRRGMWWVSSAVVHVLLLGVSSVLAWIVGGIVASPVYDRLSAKVESLTLGEGDGEAFSWKLVMVDVWLGVTHSLFALALYLMLACPLSILGFVPVVGQVVQVVLGTTVSAMFLSRELLDYSTSRRRYGFGKKLGLLWRHLPLTLGMGMCTFGMLWVPLANFLSMPAAVIGGTLLFCELTRQGLLEGPVEAA